MCAQRRCYKCFMKVKFLQKTAWFKMPRGQRVAVLAVLCLILSVTVVRYYVSRHQSIPVAVEEKMEDLAKFCAEIDSAHIDTTVNDKRKERKKVEPSPVREMEEIPVY